MSLIKKPNEVLPKRTLTALLYGQAGMGKTTLALSAPAPLLFDFDGGAHRVEQDHRVDTVQPNSWEDFNIVLSQEDLSGYKTVVIDTAGKMLDLMAQSIISQNTKMGWGGSLNQQGYGRRKIQFQMLLGRMQLLGKNLIFVAHETTDRDGDTMVKAPQMTGSSRNDLINEIDLVGYLEAHTKTRTVSFGPDARFVSKKSIAALDDVVQLPNVNIEENDLMSQIVDKHRESIKEQEARGLVYMDLVEEIKERSSSIDGVESASEYFKWLKEQEVINDSKRVGWLHLKAAGFAIKNGEVVEAAS